MNLITNDIGFDLGVVGDIGFGYEVPYYTETTFNVLDTRFNTLAGGRSHITISLYFFRFTVYFDVIGAKLTSSNRLKVDVVNYD